MDITNAVGRQRKWLPGMRRNSYASIEDVGMLNVELVQKIEKLKEKNTQISSILSEIEKSNDAREVKRSLSLLKETLLKRVVLRKEILKVQDNCVCDFYVSYRGLTEDSYICNKCCCTYT